MTRRSRAGFTAGWIAGLLSALAVALALGLWAGLSFHAPAPARPTAAVVSANTGTLEMVRPAACDAHVSITVTATRLYALGNGSRLRHARPLSERMNGDRLVLSLPLGMYRVRTSLSRAVQNRFVLPGVVNNVELCGAMIRNYATSLRDV